MNETPQFPQSTTDIGNNKPCRVVLVSPTEDEPFRRLECTIVDAGHADRILTVECAELGAELEKRNARHLSELNRAYERLSGAQARADRLAEALRIAKSGITGCVIHPHAVDAINTALADNAS